MCQSFRLVMVMSKYNIYKCSYGIPIDIPKVIEKYNVDFGLANRDGLKMGELAEKIYYELGRNTATLPFGHTIEAQAFGAKVRFDYINGNRIIDYPQSITRPDLNDINVQMVFGAIKYLKGKNIPITFNISGPVSIATSILPTEEVYRGMVKNTENMRKVFSIIEDFLREYINKIIELDIDILSYADPAGTMDIVGKRVFKSYAGTSFLKVLDKVESKRNTIIYICPKSLSSLLEADLIGENEEGVISGGTCISNGFNSKLIKRYSLK